MLVRGMGLINFYCELGLIKCIASWTLLSPCIDMIGGSTCMVATILLLLIVGICIVDYGIYKCVESMFFV
jgi:hypothetical protein